MGIPSYFSYLLKRQKQIIRPVVKSARYDSLYLDCNSIVYDSYYSLKPGVPDIETTIINETIARIRRLIFKISPRNVIYIAFDGVAPFAKMKQQKTRRYKSWIIGKLGVDAAKNNGWNTSAVTPGTEFMAKLMNTVKTTFCHKESTWNVRSIIVSGSDEPGEGEHKLFSYMRVRPGNEQVAVYGLDADLIMLALIHVKYCGNIHICREAPAFGKDRGQPASGNPASSGQDRGQSASGKEDANELLSVDTNKLLKSIYDEMNCGGYIHGRVLDYIFICFMLGNDFMPHFPAVNIRTQGIRILMDAYTQAVQQKSGSFNYLVSEETGIHWANVKSLLKILSDNEHRFMMEEYEKRAKMAEHLEKVVHDMPKKEQWENIPMLYRGKELYICPTSAGWERRYYETLFPEGTLNNVGDVIQNYMEGLEWVFHYYTRGCPCWKWSYKYNYAPLLCDLYAGLDKRPRPSFRTSAAHIKHCVTPEEQLKFVLPRAHWGELIPGQKVLQTEEPLPKVSELFVWSFCKYMWEAHVEMVSAHSDKNETIPQLK
jgi:5'-3' exonuclease